MDVEIKLHFWCEMISFLIKKLYYSDIALTKDFASLTDLFIYFFVTVNEKFQGHW